MAIIRIICSLFIINYCAVSSESCRLPSFSQSATLSLRRHVYLDPWVWRINEITTEVPIDAVLVPIYIGMMIIPMIYCYCILFDEFLRLLTRVTEIVITLSSCRRPYYRYVYPQP